MQESIQPEEIAQKYLNECRTHRCLFSTTKEPHTEYKSKGNTAYGDLNRMGLSESNGLCDCFFANLPPLSNTSPATCHNSTLRGL